jgi:hypothetical protein
MDCHLFGIIVLLDKIQVKKKIVITIVNVKKKLELVKMNFEGNRNANIGVISNCSKGEKNILKTTLKRLEVE